MINKFLLKNIITKLVVIAIVFGTFLPQKLVYAVDIKPLNQYADSVPPKPILIPELPTFQKDLGIPTPPLVTENHGVISGSPVNINNPSFTITSNYLSPPYSCWDTINTCVPEIMLDEFPVIFTPDVLTTSGVHYLRARSYDPLRRKYSVINSFAFVYTSGNGDSTAPSTSASYPLDWLNQFIITVTAADTGWGVKNVTCAPPAGSTIQTAQADQCKYRITQNGIFTYSATDYADNTSNLESITITNIDSTAPPAVSGSAIESHGIESNTWTNESNPSFSWTAVSDPDESGLAGYRVYFGTSLSGTPSTILTSNSYTPTPRASNISASYYLRAASFDNAGNGSSVNTIFIYKYDAIKPISPTNLTEINGVESGEYQSEVKIPEFAWDAGADNNSGIKGYRVYWGTDPNATEPSSETLISPTARSFMPGPFDEVSLYYLKVFTEDNAGNLSIPTPAFEFVPANYSVTKYYALGTVTSMDKDGEFFTLISDQVSSTSLVVDAAGNKVAETRYYPFGEVRYIDGTLPTDHTYTGQRSEDFGLMDYNARFYSPVTGKFISADTLIPEPGSPQSWDRYAYVNNNPVNFVDPSGHWVFEDSPNDPNYVPAHSGINPFRRYVTTGVTQGEAEKIFRRYMKDPITDATPGPFSFGDHRGTYDYKGTQWSGLNIWHASYDEEDEAGIPVNPLYPGKVIFTGWTGMGNTVVIENIIYGNRFYSVYGHFGNDKKYTGINVNVGDLVSYTSVIGETGYSKPGCDNSCYKHLHFEVRKACNVNLSNTADVLYGMRYWAFEGENWKDYFVDLGLRWGYEEDNFVGHD